jgi:hypothetical protein
MKLHLAIDAVQRSENDLAKSLRLLAEHHATEHDLYHLGHTLSQQCIDRIDRLLPFIPQYDAHAVDPDGATVSRLAESLRHKAAEVFGRIDVVGIVMLRDLRDAYLVAQQVEIDWTILTQAAKAARDQNLIDVASSCTAEAEHTAKWLRTRIKVSTAQVLATK